MELEMKVTFTKEELIDMCLAKCADIKTAIPGKFEASFDYTDSVICTFISDEDQSERDVVLARIKDAREAERAAKIRNENVVEPLRSVVNAISEQAKPF